MSINIGTLAPLVALVAGILILIMPRLLNYIVAIYLIVIGILGSRQVTPRAARREPKPAFCVSFQSFTCAGSPRAGFLV